METSILQWKEGASVRMQMIKDEPWFAAKDLCEVLRQFGIKKRPKKIGNLAIIL